MANDTHCWSLIDEAIHNGADDSLPLQTRVQSIVDALHSLASMGNSSEFLSHFLVASANRDAVRAAEGNINRSISTIADLASETGVAISSPQAYAADWVATLEGALLLLALIGKAGPFARTLQRLLDLTKEPVAAQ